MTKLLVAYGYSGDQNTVEIVNLDPSHPELICDNLPNLPENRHAATGQLYKGTLPTVCGGYGIGAGYFSDCHQFQNGTWNPIASMSGKKSQMESFVVSKDDEESFVVAGGWYGEGLSTAESFDGQKWNEDQFEDLPEPVFRHCLVKVNNTMLISTGGRINSDYSGNTNVLNVLDNTWTPGPQLRDPRSEHTCGVMNWKNPDTGSQEKVVVVAGGVGDPGFVLSTELLFLDQFNSGWVAGPSLPKEVSDATMVDFQDGVIHIGGSGNVDGFHLYQLSSPNGSWTLMDQTLKESRVLHVSFLVPDELVNCH